MNTLFSKSQIAVLAVALALCLPLAAGAHYINPDTSRYMAAVGADGHDHVHAEEAHGVGDGHTDHSHAPGASSILVPGTGQWWGVMIVSLLLMSLLSFGVWKYLQVAPVQSANEKKESEEKKEDKPAA